MTSKLKNTSSCFEQLQPVIRPDVPPLVKSIQIVSEPSGAVAWPMPPRRPAPNDHNRRSDMFSIMDECLYSQRINLDYFTFIKILENIVIFPGGKTKASFQMLLEASL